jgi:hypothetical protein
VNVLLQASSGKVYRPGQPKTRSRFSLRRLFYTNPLLSPPFTSAANSAAAAASSPGRFRQCCQLGRNFIPHKLKKGSVKQKILWGLNSAADFFFFLFFLLPKRTEKGLSFLNNKLCCTGTGTHL